MSEPLNLIQKAIQYSREARIAFRQKNLGTQEPLSPNARRNLLYLQMRENISTGCRKAVKWLYPPYKRSIAFSLLMQTVVLIFQVGKDDRIVQKCNALLDEMVGTH